jgi:hypothetical protein
VVAHALTVLPTLVQQLLANFGDNKGMNLVNYFPIIHCEFEYSCPLNWGELKLTDNASVRYCDQCSKEVTLCTDDAQIDLAWEQGKCIAHPFYDTQMLKAIDAYEKGEGPDPFVKLSMPMGLPKNRNSS